ncbi:MAG: RusA family crossover junction endodeoxyribonuclease [Caulobacteraceae bacterium]|nr:RusA family crossover junction endodeoxyribonuclease [Caulobacteraceae bacterium]
MVDAGKGDGWTASGKVRAREVGGAIDIQIDGLTTQARYYKPLIYEFFRKQWRGARPAYGDFSVEIVMEHVGDPPWMDLDNLAKALLDGIKGYVFHDDAQVARLLVERREGERERILIRVSPRVGSGGPGL